MKKFNKVVKNDDVNVLPVSNAINPVIEPIITTPTILPASEPKTEISELEKIRNENKLLQEKLAEVSKKKSPGFIKNGICAHEVLFADLVKSLTSESIAMTENDYRKLLDYDILANKAMAGSGSKSYTKSSAELDSKYFKRSLDALRVRYDLIAKPTAPVPVAEVSPVIADVKA